MKLRDLPIGRQLGLGLGAILALVLLLGSVAWLQADSLWLETQGLYEHPLLVRRAVGEIKADILAMHRGLKDAVLAESDQEIEQALQEIDRYEADAHRQFTIVYDRYLGPRSDIEAAERVFVEWKAIRDETIRLLRAGQVAEAVRRTKPTGTDSQHVDLILAALQEVSDFAAARGDQFYADAQGERDALRVRLALVLGGILLLAAVISYFLLRGIRTPLKELTAVTERYRQGRSDARSQYVSSNEFGVLAASFNALADNVQTEMQSRANAAGIADVMLREDELAGFCRALLTALVEHTGSQVAAIYLLNAARTAFEHYESIGLGAGSRLAFDAAGREGEFGAALVTRQIQHITEIPAATPFTFATVSGEFRPAAILTLPILAGPEVVAVISLASLRPYPAAAVRLVHDMWSVLTARLNGVLALRQLRTFSEQLAGQNRELEVQKQELTAQADELTAQTDELTEQNIELELQKQQLAEANRLKSRFLSNMSHELRTPLNSVIALAGVLSRRLRHVVPEEEYGYLDVIERNGKHLLALINDILDLSRIEAGREEVVLETFAVRDLAAEIIAMIEPQAQERGIALLNEVAADLPPITSDRAKCRHILQNLVGNAVKFTEAGQVTVAAASAAAAVQIAVRDTGIGIAAEQLPYIFDEFRQADESTSRKYGGTGLGLAIAKKYAAMLRGDIAVASTPGRGSTFTLTLPLALTAADAGAPSDAGPTLRARPRWSASTPQANPLAAPPAGRGQRILLVEDSEPAIIQMRDILAGQGYEITIARNGREALAQIARTPPDALILDLMMPEVDGFEVLRTVRGAPATAHLPVLILTAKHMTREDLSFLTDNHIQELIQKGAISRAELLAAVAALFAPAPAAPVTPPPVRARSEMRHDRGHVTLRTATPPAAFAAPETSGAAGVEPSGGLTLAQRNRLKPRLQWDGNVLSRGSDTAIASRRLISEGSRVPEGDSPPAKPVILVVEDNLDNLRTARALLRDHYRVIEATDGRAGVAQALAHHPDLILMDIALPVLDGIQALAAIRAEAALRHTLVIALTASAMTGDREEILAYGFDGYLAKPIDAALLIQTIQEALDGD